MQNSVSMAEIMEDATTCRQAYATHSGLGPPVSINNQNSSLHTSQFDLGIKWGSLLKWLGLCQFDS